MTPSQCIKITRCHILETQWRTADGSPGACGPAHGVNGLFEHLKNLTYFFQLHIVKFGILTTKQLILTCEPHFQDLVPKRYRLNAKKR